MTATFVTSKWSVGTMVVCLLAGVCTGVEFAGGTGEPNDPYQIATAEQLIGINSDPNLFAKHFVLTADIDLDPSLPGGRVFRGAVVTVTGVISRGPVSSRGGFDGSFDGAGHVIRNCTICAESGGSNAALFHRVSSQGHVRDLRLEEVTILGVADTYSGCYAALAGWNAGLITDCSATGLVIAGDKADLAGGLVCQNAGIVRRCSSGCDVSGGVAGGLVGQNDASGRIEFCSADGIVFDSDADTTGVGGLVGVNLGMVRGCSSGGYIVGDSAGGVAGSNAGTIRESCSLETLFDGQSCGGIASLNSGTILNCYSIGSVPGDGLCQSNEGTILSCYSTTASRVAPSGRGAARGRSVLIQASAIGDIRYVYYLDAGKADTPIRSSVSSSYGMPLSPSQMAQRGSFVGFDFYGDANDGAEDHWFMPADGYPVLSWQTEHTGLTGTPDVAGLSAEEAQTLLEQAGFAVAGVDRDYFSPQGQVVRISPAAYVSPGTPVRLLVGEGSYDFTENAGDGSEMNPFQIETAGQLESLRDRPDLWASHFVLTADIDWTGRTVSGALIDSFGGTFNGAGHSIRGLKVQRPESASDPLGLFGTIAESGVVRGLTLQGATLDDDSGGIMVGLLAGENKGAIQGCRVWGRIGTFGNECGGLVGFNLGQVLDSRFSGSVWAYEGSRRTGGLAGENCGLIRGCCARGGDVYGDEQVGGLVGRNHGDLASIEACYAQGTVLGSDRVGGLLGENGAHEGLRNVRFEPGEVRDCYAACSMPARTGAGACIGSANPGTVQERCYFLAPEEGDGPDNGCGTALTDSQMKQQASFAGWDFEGTWTICAGVDYPRLQWEGIECDE
ncbi:MAG: PASTA domain-containing protein [Phycisphaerales bacterium]